MTEDDYDDVRALWMTIRGFGIRALDDSREDVQRFIRRNPTTSVVARMASADPTAARVRCITYASRGNTAAGESARTWSGTACISCA